jgi:hypothetical protein
MNPVMEGNAHDKNSEGDLVSKATSALVNFSNNAPSSQGD